MAKSKKNHSIDRTRLTWVLAILVASMTIGTVFLGLLEPKGKLTTETTYLAATYNTSRASKISRTQIPVDTDRWDAIVIHTTGQDLRLPALRTAQCTGDPIAHFGIDPDGVTLITTQWTHQQASPVYDGTIQIALQLRNGQTEATLTQAQAIVNLLRDLQARCRIPASRIFLYSELSSKATNASDPLCRYNWRDPNVLLP